MTDRVLIIGTSKPAIDRLNLQSILSEVCIFNKDDWDLAFEHLDLPWDTTDLLATLPAVRDEMQGRRVLLVGRLVANLLTVSTRVSILWNKAQGCEYCQVPHISQLDNNLLRLCVGYRLEQLFVDGGGVTEGTFSSDPVQLGLF